MPGFLATFCVNSARFFTPAPVDATSTSGCEAMRPMAVKSFTSYFTFLVTSLLMAISLLAPTRKV
ncbi:hypothetical protein D3C72_2031570 [compost metagenome]